MPGSTAKDTPFIDSWSSIYRMFDTIKITKVLRSFCVLFYKQGRWSTLERGGAQEAKKNRTLLHLERWMQLSPEVLVNNQTLFEKFNIHTLFRIVYGQVQ